MNNKKKGFTLAEVLLTLTVLGALYAITMPILKNALPNFNTYRAKKINITFKTTVDDMLNKDNQYEGFHDFSNTGTMVQGEKHVANVNTFRNIFVKYVDMIEVSKCQAYGVKGGEIDCYKSADGMLWAIPDTDFETEENGSVVVEIENKNGNGSKSKYCPITVYPDFKKDKAKKDPQKYMIENAIVYGLRRDGKIVFIEDDDVFNCEKFPKLMQCVAIREISSSRMKRR